MDKQRNNLREAFELIDQDKSGMVLLNSLGISQVMIPQRKMLILESPFAGTIDFRELKVAMSSLGIQASDEEVARMMSTVGKDRTGSIDFEKFVLMMKNTMDIRFVFECIAGAGDTAPPRKGSDGKQKVDTTSEGEAKEIITLYDLKHFSKQYKVEIPDEELLDMITELDNDGDWMIGLEEFKAIVNELKQHKGVDPQIMNLI